MSDTKSRKYNVILLLCSCKHKHTKEIIRHGSNQSCPCHVYPQIFPITPVALDEFELDVKNFQGTVWTNPKQS